MKNKKVWIIALFALAILMVFAKFFSEESQNKFSRAMGTTLGFKTGCVEIYAGQLHPVKRFMGVEKLSTAIGTDDNLPRPYRYGYGYLDENLNDKIDSNEKKKGKKYFEVGDYSQYIYYVK